MRNMFKKKTNIIVIFFLLATIYLVANRATPLDFLVLLVPIIAIAGALPLKGTLDSLVPRFLFSIAIYTAVVQVFGMLMRIFRFSFGYKLYLVLLLTTAFVMCLQAGVSRRQFLYRLKPQTKDYYSLLAASIMLMILVGGTLAKGGLNSNSAIRLVTGGLDDLSHLSMTSDEYRHSANFLVGGPGSGVSISADSSYPKGWHVVTALGWLSFDGLDGKSPATATVMSEVNMYVITKVIYFFIVILALSTVIIWFITDLLSNSLSKHPQLNTVGLLAQPVIYLTALVLVIPIFKEGFFSFYPVIFYTSVALLAGYYLYNKDNSRLSTACLLSILMLCAAAISLSWLLLGPAFFLFIVLLLTSYRKFDLATLRQMLRPTNRQFLIWFLVLGTVCATTTLAGASLQAKYNGHPLGIITTAGGIVPIDLIFFITMLLGFIAFCCWLKRSAVQALIYFAFSFALETFLVWLYQLGKQQILSYYFYKLETPLILVLAIGASCAFVYMAIKTTDSLKPVTSYNKFIFSLCLLLLVVFSILFISGNYSYNLRFLFGSRTFSKPTTAQLESRLDGQVFGDKSIRTYYLTQDTNTNILGTAFLRLSHPISMCDQKLFDDGYVHDVIAFREDLKHCLKTSRYNFLVVVDNKTDYQSIETLSGQASDHGRLTLEQY
jgi:hypothetical protein